MKAECRKCGDEFAPTPSQVKKHDWLCPPCKRQYDRAWRARRRARGLPASGSDTWDPEKKRRWKERYYRDPDVLARKARQQRKYRKQPTNRHKKKARWKLNRAVQSGSLERQSCEACGREEDVHGHHEDYDRPLEVVWLCRACHDALHARAEGE